MLELDRVARGLARHPRELRETREAARRIGDELREIVRRLRPEALDDLGLRSALMALTERFAEQTGSPVGSRLAPSCQALEDEAELAFYRVAQEASPTWRVTRARSGRSSCATRPTVVLQVVDDGAGWAAAGPGAGYAGCASGRCWSAAG